MKDSGLRRFGTWAARPVVAVLRGWVHPNAVTVTGTIFSLVAGGFVATGHFLFAAAFLIIGSCCDWIDGELARTTGLTSDFGGFFDSVLDRISDGAPLTGLAIYFAGQGRLFEAGAAAMAALMSSAIPYAKARLEVLGHTAEIGILPRAPRAALVVASVLAGPAVAGYGVAIIALLATITVIQRIQHGYTLLKAR